MLMNILAKAALALPQAAADADAANTADAPGNPADSVGKAAQTLRDIDWQQLLIDYGVPALGALILLFMGWLVASWIGRIAAATLRKARIDETLCRFLGKLVRWTIILFVILGCIGLFGVDVTSFAAVIAAAGFAIGLAFQGTLSSFSAGIMLLIFRPFKIGDYVNVGGQSGTVYEIGLFTTSLDTPDNRRIILPNSSVFGNTIENITFHDKRRVEVIVGTSYDDDIDHVRQALFKAIDSIEQKLDEPAPAVLLTGFGASSIDWSVRVWVPTKDFWPVKDALTRAIKYGLDAANVSIPFPQMEVHLPRAAATGN